MTGEVLSRLTTDTTLVLSVIGSSVSVALRNVLTLVGGLVLLFSTSPKLTGARPRRRAARRRADPHARPPAARALAREPGPHRRLERPGLREPARGADRAGLYPRGGEPRRLRRADRGRLRLRARPHPHPRAHDAIVIFLVFASIVARALDRRARRARRRHDPGRAGPVRDLLGDGRRRGRRALRDLGRAAARRRRHRADGRAAPRRRPDRRPGQPARRCRRGCRARSPSRA